MGDVPTSLERVSHALNAVQTEKNLVAVFLRWTSQRTVTTSGLQRQNNTREERFLQSNQRPQNSVANVDVIIDNPPYTGKGMKEKILTLLVTKDIPFCLLLPLGVLHAKFLRDLTKTAEKVPTIIRGEFSCTKKTRKSCRLNI